MLIRADVFVMYRFLNLSNPSRILTTANPTFEDFLPVDDERFADAVRLPYTVSSSFFFFFFAKICINYLT